jgi:hypothetical protein
MQLVGFGFDQTQASAALDRAGGDLNAALDLLMGDSEDGSGDDY